MEKLPVYWIWFAQLSGINCRQKRQLLESFRDPEELNRMAESARQLQGVT